MPQNNAVAYGPNPEKPWLEFKPMSRIDVVPADHGKFKVMVNMGANGCNTYSNAAHANKEATMLHDGQYPHHDLNLAKIEDKQ